MKLKDLIEELTRIRSHVGDDAEVEVTGLYSAYGDIERVDYQARYERSITHVNGQPESDVTVNKSTVTLKTNCG